MVFSFIIFSWFLIIEIYSYKFEFEQPSLNTDKLIRNSLELQKLVVSSVSKLAAFVVDDLRISSESESLEDIHVDQSVQSAVQAKEVVVVQRNRLEQRVHVESIRVKLPGK